METILTSPSFVINLPRCSDRLHYSMEQLKNAGYSQVSVFQAIDGIQSSEVEEALKIFHYPKLDSIKPGAIGCLLTHMKLLNHIIEQNIPITNIFEDDIHFHPEWEVLSKEYYALTPIDYDVLFIGNQLENPLTLSEITSEYCYCTHAYIVTLEGAKKMLNVILQYIKNGLREIDCILKEVFNKHKSEGISSPFVLYSWNGTKYPCYYNTSANIHCRNTGLVFQNMQFISQIDDSKIVRDKIQIQPQIKKSRNFKKMILQYVS
jgi:glycosyl transferase family 25